MRNHSLLLLSLAAGCVDAIAFLHVGVFPANMTGNTVVLGLALAKANVTGVALSGLALVGFFIGAVIGAKITSRSKSHPRQIGATLLIGGILLLAHAALLALRDNTVSNYLVIISAIAMGMQSAAVQRLGISGVSTVVITGTFTTAITRLVDGMKPKEADASTPWLPALSWLGYLGGALIGGLESAYHSPLPIILPGVILTSVALLELRRDRA